jgi:hypothetical protein
VFLDDVLQTIWIRVPFSLKVEWSPEKFSPKRLSKRINGPESCYIAEYQRDAVKQKGEDTYAYEAQSPALKREVQVLLEQLKYVNTTNTLNTMVRTKLIPVHSTKNR